jgi:hypothetical protein
MDFAWSEEQTELRERVLEMARRELNEGLAQRDAAGAFHREGFRLCGRLGIQGMPVPVRYGGGGLDPLTTVGVLESLGYGCLDNGLVFSINAHMWTAEIPILEFGSEEQKERLLPGLCSGEQIGGNAMTEPAAGSDAHALTTVAERRGDRYLLRGGKCFVTNGPVADVLVVYANADPARGPNGITAFLVEKGMPGLSVGGNQEKMGLRTSPMAELHFDGCEVPAANRLGREGAGRALFANSMTWERACILASAVGSMQRLLEGCVRHARERRQFGRAIGKNQMIQSRIVDMKLRLETARALLYQAAWLRGQGRSIFLEAALAKLHISESWVACAQDAIQIHGAYGYMSGAEAERELRDAVGSRIFSGTNEIQRSLVASLLGL